MAAKKKISSSTKKSASSPKAQAKVGKVMHEFKQGQLKSGGRAKVKNPKQAIAIGLSEARRAGAAVAPKRTSAAKKKSAPARKTSSAVGRKTAAKRPGASKKTAAKSSPRAKSSARKKS
jgi:hypothetical protein